MQTCENAIGVILTRSFCGYVPERMCCSNRQMDLCKWCYVTVKITSCFFLEMESGGLDVLQCPIPYERFCFCPGLVLGKQDRGFNPLSYGIHRILSNVIFSEEYLYYCSWEVLFNTLRK